jgi:tetratricopeptide (TPR) repeat protein
MHKLALAVALLAALPLSGQLAEGDQQWSLRAEGHVGGRANPARIDAAIAAYERAVAANPNDLAARWKLLRAYRFKGQYAAPSLETKKQIYTRARNAGEQALAVVDRMLAARGLGTPAKAPEKQVASVARTIPGAGEIYLWDSINWGEWALAYGKMAAARQGAADRIRREATIALLIDPQLEAGTPARVLGRLHDQTPRIPFVTGWASSREAVRFLRESLKIDPSNKITKVFLAEAMVSNDSGAKPAAIALLREVVSAPNDPQYEVEQAAATADAKALLKAWGATAG